MVNKSNAVAVLFGAGALILALLGCGGGAQPASVPSGPASSQAPVFSNPQNNATPKSGTSWTYDYTVSEASPWPLPTAGTLGIRYDGSVSYRGSAYPETESVGSISGQDVYVYFTLNNGFAEMATANTYAPAMPCSTPPRSETVLSIAADFIHPHPLTTGTAQTYLCTSPSSVLNWSLVVNSAGSATVSVPAGTFLTTKITGVWTLGSVERDYTAYLYGNDVIQRDTTQYRNGSFDGSFSVKLRSGPTDVAIPGPSTLGADYW